MKEQNSKKPSPKTIQDLGLTPAEGNLLHQLAQSMESALGRHEEDEQYEKEFWAGVEMARQIKAKQAKLN